jgi:hypothetical protein
MEKISWMDRVKNEELLHTVEEERNILQNNKKKAAWIRHTLRKNFHLKHAMEGKIEGTNKVTGRGRRRKQLPATG